MKLDPLAGEAQTKRLRTKKGVAFNQNMVVRQLILRSLRCEAEIKYTRKKKINDKTND